MPGVFPSDWYTTVWIYNPSPDTVVARLLLLERGTANPSPPWVDLSVPASDTQMVDNIVETLFRKQMSGAIRVVAPAKLVVSSRVYSKGARSGDRDSTGQDFAGVPASFAIGLHEKSQILGARQTLPTGSSDFRYNFGLVETTGHTVTVRVTAFDTTGAEQGHRDIQVRECSQGQWAFKDCFPQVSTESSRLEVEVIAGTGKVIAYASGITNGSQDPTASEMEYPPEVLAENVTPGITGVTAGDGLTEGGTTGAVTLSVGAGDGISVSADAIAIADGGVTPDKLQPSAATGQVLATVGGGSPAPPGTVAALATNTVAWQSLSTLSVGLTPYEIAYGSAGGGLAQDPGKLVWYPGDHWLDIVGALKLSSPAGAPPSSMTALLQVDDYWFLHGSGSSDNTFVGPGAGNFTMTGFGNTGAGSGALLHVTSGFRNSELGKAALRASTTGYDNVAVGSTSLASNTGGDGNSAPGATALLANITGSRNTAVDAGAMRASTGASDCTAVGYQALSSRTAVGANTAVGSGSLQGTTSGTGNVAVGLQSLMQNVAGNSNTAVGNAAGYSSLGSGNLFLGNMAGYFETGSNRLHIANASNGTLIYGQFDSKRVGIDATGPTATLDVTELTALLVEVAKAQQLEIDALKAEVAALRR